MKRRAPKRRVSTSPSPRLRFTPFAWAKLLFLRDTGHTEVGGFGISTESDLLLVRDLVLPRQTCSAVTVSFHDDSVADYFDRQIELGRKPQEFGRIWIHTHPGDSPCPSLTDEETFARVFGRCDWAVMAILAEEGTSYARIRFEAGPGGEFRIPVEVDFACGFEGADPESWAAEYEANVGRWPLELPGRNPFEALGKMDLFEPAWRDLADSDFLEPPP